jgi:Ca2+:H+ antiporter
MAARPGIKIFSWTVVVPVLATVLLAFTWGRDIGVLIQVAVASRCGRSLAAVNHAEVVAHRVGEPFGSLVLESPSRSSKWR